jgi:hypothetical protein
VLTAASVGLSLVLYEGYSASFRFTAPPVSTFSYQAADTGAGFEQVLAVFQFDRNVVFQGILYNGTYSGFSSLSAAGTIVRASGWIEFFSATLPQDGPLSVANASLVIVDGFSLGNQSLTHGRHAFIVKASGNYSLAAPGFSASRQVGLSPLPLLTPDDVSKPARAFALLLPMVAGTRLSVTLLFQGGTASGAISA